MHSEIQLRISATNQAYYALNKMLSKTTKELYTCYLRPVAMHVKIGSLPQGDEEKLVKF